MAEYAKAEGDILKHLEEFIDPSEASTKKSELEDFESFKDWQGPEESTPQDEFGEVEHSSRYSAEREGEGLVLKAVHENMHRLEEGEPFGRYEVKARYDDEGNLISMEFDIQNVDGESNEPVIYTIDELMYPLDEESYREMQEQYSPYVPGRTEEGREVTAGLNVDVYVASQYDKDEQGQISPVFYFRHWPYGDPTSYNSIKPHAFHRFTPKLDASRYGDYLGSEESVRKALTPNPDLVELLSRPPQVRD